MIDDGYKPDAEIQEVGEADLMDLADHDTLRGRILGSVKSAFERRFPIEGNGVRLEVSNLGYNESRAPAGIARMKKARMEGGTLGIPLHGDVRLVDTTTGEILDERKKHLLANVPWLTHRGTFVNRGTEYVTFNQALLRPGIYSRTKENGELEAHINVKAGTGPGMRMYMEPDTGVYRLSVGTSRIKLYPILRALGKTDDDLAAAWGPEVLDMNRRASDAKSFARFYDKLIGNRGPAMMARLVGSDARPRLGEDDDDGPDEDQLPLSQKVGHATMAEARAAVEKNPTISQIEASNYAKGHVTLFGLRITIENPKGSYRRGRDRNGTEWRTELAGDYGYIKGTEGADGDHIDVFVGPNHDSEIAFVVDQVVGGKFDEVKVVLGADTADEARSIYLGSYSPGWSGLGTLTPVSLSQLKWWLDNGNHKKPFAGQTVKLAMDLAPGISGASFGRKMQIGSESGPGAAADLLSAPAAPMVGSGPGSPAAQLLGRPRPTITTAVTPKVASVRELSDQDRVDLVLRQLSRMEVDPEVSHRTLGKAHRDVDPDTLLDTSSRLLSISRGESEPDDRDALGNKWFRTPDDMFADRISKDAGKIGQALFWRSKYDRSLKRLKPGHFTPQLQGLIVGNSLSQAVSGINPMELMDLRQKVVQTGEGGISSVDMIPDVARDVHPSQVGFIDYIKTPESSAVGVDQRFAWSVRKGPNNQIYTKLHGKDGSVKWRTPSQLYGKRVAFPGMSRDEPLLI